MFLVKKRHSPRIKQPVKTKNNSKDHLDTFIWYPRMLFAVFKLCAIFSAWTSLKDAQQHQNKHENKLVSHGQKSPLYTIWGWSCRVRCHLGERDSRHTRTHTHLHTYNHHHHHLTWVKQFLRKRRVVAGMLWIRSGRGDPDLKVNWPDFPWSLWIGSDWIGFAHLITCVSSAQCVWQHCVHENVGSNTDLQPGRRTQGEKQRGTERGEERKGRVVIFCTYLPVTDIHSLYRDIKTKPPNVRE